MIPISGLINIGINMLSIPIAVKDYVYTTAAGEDSRVQYGTRTQIFGALDPTMGKQMERIFGGSASSGDIMIITSDTLYIDDLPGSADTRKQSFVTYHGTTYRCSNSAEWELQAGTRVYLCKRHISQDSL